MLRRQIHFPISKFCLQTKLYSIILRIRIISYNKIIFRNNFHTSNFQANDYNKTDINNQLLICIDEIKQESTSKINIAAKKLLNNVNDEIGSKPHILSNNNNNNDLRHFLLKSKEKITTSLGTISFEYSSRRCTHMVAQSFKYIPKESEAKEIVSFMQNRQRLRLEANRILRENEEDNSIPTLSSSTFKDKMSQEDKRKNPLITISGSPGIGKSTFLCHFPESKEYQDYCSKKKSGKSPIVSTLTFNIVMSLKPDCFELRIIYGAINAMGLGADITWNEFLSRFENHQMNSNEVIYLLQDLFGADRPILILVDEISRSEDDKNVMKTIGFILDSHDFVDVVVSSLSPNYIRILLSGSNRPIDYAIVYPLLRSGLGKKECEIWANNIISKCGNDVKLDDFKVNLLKNVYLLFSGHPRSIELMKDLLEDKNKDWSKVVEDLKDKYISFGGMLETLVFKFENEYSDLDALNSNFLEQFIFRHPITRSPKNQDLKMLLEAGDILVYNLIGSQFKTFAQLQSLLFFH